MARAPTNDRPRDNQEVLGDWVERRDGADRQFRRLLGDRENELHGLAEAEGPRSVAFRTAEQTMRDHYVEYGQIKEALRRPLHKLSIRWRFFAAFALALALLEAPVNKYLFDVALQGSNFVSYSVSIVVAFFLLIIAHLAGKCLRQIWSERRRKIIWSNLLIFFACTTVISTVICILTVGRASTSAAASMTGFADIFSAVGSQIGSLGLWRTLGNAFSDLSALILATVNIGGAFVAMLLAYFSHDPDRDFDVASVALERSRTKLASMQASYIAKRKKIIQTFKPDLIGASSTHGEASKSVIGLKTRLSMPIGDDDRFVIDELDRLAEDSEHAEEAGVIEESHLTQKPPLREVPRKAS